MIIEYGVHLYVSKMGMVVCSRWQTTNVSGAAVHTKQTNAKHMTIIIKAIPMEVSLVRPFFFLFRCFRFYLFSEIVSKLKATRSRRTHTRKHTIHTHRRKANKKR